MGDKSGLLRITRDSEHAIAVGVSFIISGLEQALNPTPLTSSPHMPLRSLAAMACRKKLMVEVCVSVCAFRSGVQMCLLMSISLILAELKTSSSFRQAFGPC